MATFTKINSFTEKLAEKSFNLGSDQLKIALTNTAHTSTWSQLSELTQISYTNLSGATPLNLTTSSSAQTAGTYKLVIADLTLTATGAVGPFRYVYVYSDTATNKELIAYFDYGSSISLATGETFTLDFDGSTGLLTLA
jgi:hypothetical protein